MTTFQKLRISIPFVACSPTTNGELDGPANPYWQLITLLDRSVPYEHRGLFGAMYVWDSELLEAMVTKLACRLVVSQGGDVERWRFFFEVAPDSVVPESLPDSRHMVQTEPESEPVPGDLKTWREWMPDSEQVYVAGGKTYIKGVGSDKQYLPASVWVPLEMAGVPVVEFAVVSAAIAAESAQ